MTGMVSIDTTRVYAAGFSAGGMMALRLGCNIPNKIAAVVSVASTQPTYQLNECNISQPMPVMFVIGTLDPIIQWNGMDFYLSAQDSVGYWIAHNDCEGTTEVVEEFDEDKDTLERVRRETYGGCADDTEVTIYGSIGGGHTWPGHPIEAPFDLGKTLMDIDANEVIWDFFTRYAVSDEKDAATPEATPTEG
jgi:polyhydroxybutyrate depolymerase